MIKIYNKPLLLLILVIVSIVTVTSCKKDEAVNSGQIQLLSFGPTGAKHGDTIKFIGNNLNQVTEIDFTGTGAVVAQSAFIQQSSEVIMVVVPQLAEQGFVTLKTAQGIIVSKSKLNLNVAATITSMTAEARPGENITINGQYLNWVRRVTFANDKVVDTFISQAIDKLVVKVPIDAQTGPLIIFYGGTDSTDAQTADTFRVTLPAITSMAPNPVKHADNLTITGSNLDLVKEILFKGDTTHIKTFVSQSAGEMVVTVPASASKGKLSLIAPSGVLVQSADDVDVVLPVITLMTPNPVDAEANLTITGANLDLLTGISFVGVTNPVTTFVSQSANSLTVKVPAGSLKGKLIFSVKNSTLTVESGQDLVLNGGLPPLADFQFPIYTDALGNGFQDWSYTDTHDFNSTANVRQGAKSIKAVYGSSGYQGLTFHNSTPASTAGYTKLEFSVFGEAGTGDKKLNVVVNGNYGSPAQVTIKEGEWATFTLNLSSIGASATLGEIVMQSAGFGGTVHIDHVGLR